MKTISEFLKEARRKKKISKEKLAKITKIKKEYIDAIEKGEWNKLPEKTVVAGFVDSISSVLNLDENKQKALFRRDYSLETTRINPKISIEDKFVWEPKLTFLVSSLVVVFLTLGYLVFQYINFVKPPDLEVYFPKDGEVIKSTILVVEGKTNPEATVSVNNQPVLISDNGEFKSEIEIFEETNEVLIVAKSRSGKETVVSRKIVPELNKL